MAAHSFPAPPDLSELLKFFASSPSYDYTLATISSQPSSRDRRRDGLLAEFTVNNHGRQAPAGASVASRPRLRGGRERVAALCPRSKMKGSPESARTQATTTTTTATTAAQRRRESPPQAAANNDWNGSTQIPATAAKPLKHQILNRTYQPPAPVVVDASGATHLVQRLSKTTISSRLKSHPADEADLALAAATAAFAGAFGRRSHYQSQQNKTKTVRLHGEEDDETGGALASSSVVPSPPDSRARDGIQTLLMYRREVEKRLSLDPTHFFSATGRQD